MQRLFPLFALATLLCFAALAAGQNTPRQYYVNEATGNDAHNCTNPTNEACATIHYALKVETIGTYGTVINVAPGTYTEVAPTNPVGTTWAVGVNMDDGNIGGKSRSRMLRLLCSTFQGCLLRPSLDVQVGIVLGDNSYMEVVGFDVGDTPGSTTVYESAFSGIMLRCDKQGTPPNCQGTSTSLHAFGNKVHDIGSTANTNEGAGCPDVGAISAGSHNFTQVDAEAIGNTVYNYGGGPTISPYCNYAHGIYFSTPGGTIESNVVYNVTSEGVQVYESGCTTNISNNTIDLTGSNGILIGGNQTCTGADNNIFNNLVSRDQQNPNGYQGAALVDYDSTCTSSAPNYWEDITLFLINYATTGSFIACDNETSVINDTSLTLAEVYINAPGGNYNLTRTFAQDSTLSGGTTTCGYGSVCTPTVDAQGCAVNSSTIVRGGLQASAGSGACIPKTWPWF